MRWLMRNRPGSTLLVMHKANQIRKARRASGAMLYGDISNVFTKYAFHLLNYLGSDRCVIVHLKRDPHAVVSSLLSLGLVPGEPWGTHWLGDPTWPGFLLRATPINHYEAVAWHVFETDLRFEVLRRRIPTAHYISLEFDHLINPDQFLGTLREWGMQPTASTIEVLKQRVNLKLTQKTHATDSSAVAMAVARYRTLYLDALANLGTDGSIGSTSAGSANCVFRSSQ